MNIKELRKPLFITDVDFRIQSINKGGYATFLAYKDARVDMRRLDEVCGALNWKREHTRDNKNCVVSIWDDEKKEWVGKEDTGNESFTDKDKGLASDSFKRACFNWGIGVDLYDYPVISVKLNSNEWELKKDNKGIERAFATWNLKPKSWKWWSEIIDGELNQLAAKDENGAVRFRWKK